MQSGIETAATIEQMAESETPAAKESMAELEKMHRQANVPTLPTSPIDAHGEVVEVVPHPLPYFSLVLDGPEAWRDTLPGQFVMVETSDGLEPYLRRAFSVHDLSKTDRGARIELLAKIVGPGTRALAGKRPGERLRVLGPLGRPFDPAGPPAQVEPTHPGGLADSRAVALVAGGVGSAPLLLLGRQLLELGVRFDFFYGGRSAIDLARRELFESLARQSGGDLFATTEDGSAGERGRVTAALAARLAAGSYRKIFSCGPMGLLERLAEMGAEHGVPGEAALETPMGCGFGACLGCAVELIEGRFALCCKDGPVFACDAVKW
jgi:dihydroorotate dehydrogenase electron transfer subunit